MWGADTDGLEIFAAIALGFFWIHTLLIAYAALLDRRGLVALARRVGEAAPVRVVEVFGEGGTLAHAQIVQVGRSKGDGQVHFNDVEHRSESGGGVVEAADGARTELPAETDLSVWPSGEARAQAAALRDPAALAEALPQAKRGKGWRRTVSVPVGAVGDEVWLVEEAGDGDGDGPILAAADPRAWVTHKRRIVAAFVVGEIALAGACTALALVPPLFGPISMVGATLCLGFFLAVQPVGVALTDSLRTPDRAYLRGLWIDAESPRS